MDRGLSLLKCPDPAGDVLPGLLRQRPFTLEDLQLLAHKRSLLQSALEGMLDVILLHHPFKEADSRGPGCAARTVAARGAARPLCALRRSRKSAAPRAAWRRPPTRVLGSNGTKLA